MAVLQKKLLPIIFSLMVIFVFGPGSLFASGGQESSSGGVFAARQGGGSGGNGTGGTGKDIDYLGVAAIMLRDGNFDRAEAALNKVDLTAEEVNLIQYYTISGILKLRKADYQNAVEDFERAVDEGQDDPSIYLYLTQAYYGTGNYEKTVEAVENVRSISAYPDLFGIKTQSLWELGRTAEAFKTVQKAIEIFPEKKSFLQQKIFYLIELDLSQAAAEESQKYIRYAEGDPSAYLTIGESLRRGGKYELALNTLEMAKLKFPDNERIRLALAYVYADNNQPFTAARLIEEAAAYNGELYYEAAELYRRAKIYNRALYLNSLILDQATKAKQRFNILIETNRFEEALALEKRLDRLGALDDDGMRYAMAYVHFSAGHYEKASAYINKISGSKYFREATQLRKAIELMKKKETQYF